MVQARADEQLRSKIFTRNNQEQQSFAFYFLFFKKRTAFQREIGRKILEGKKSKTHILEREYIKQDPC